jgi:hypothetical protein
VQDVEARIEKKKDKEKKEKKRKEKEKKEKWAAGYVNQTKTLAPSQSPSTLRSAGCYIALELNCILGGRLDFRRLARLSVLR